MEKLSLKDLAWNIKQLPAFFKSFYQAPLDNIHHIDTEENLVDSFKVIAAYGFVTAIPGMLFSLFHPTTLVFGLLIPVIGCCISAGILHLLKSFLGAKGRFENYVAFCAWFMFLAAPFYFAASLIGVLPLLGNLAWLIYLAGTAAFVYSFHLIFEASLKKLIVVSAVAYALAVLPVMMIAGFQWALKQTAGGDIAQMMERMEDLDEDDFSDQKKVMEAMYGKDVAKQMMKAMERAKKYEEERQKKDEQQPEPQAAKGPCGDMVDDYQSVLKNVYIQGGETARDKAAEEFRESFTAQVNNYKKWLDKAGGEDALLERAREFPDQAKQYEDAIQNYKCMKEVVASL